MPYITYAPAVIAALHDATGVWFDEFPLTPSRVLAGLRADSRPRAAGANSSGPLRRASDRGLTTVLGRWETYGRRFAELVELYDRENAGRHDHDFHSGDRCIARPRMMPSTSGAVRGSSRSTSAATGVQSRRVSIRRWRASSSHASRPAR